ncbi:MAG: transaldolase [Kofleriaceae bacterium]
MDIGHLQPHAPISAVLTDVDGTIITEDKVLTERALRAVDQLRERGIVFTITSGRPPFGMRALVEPLGLEMPMAAFNGAVILLPDLSVLDERLLPDYLLAPLIDLIQSYGLDVWLFRTSDWCVRSASDPRVSRETDNIQQPPIVVETFEEMLAGIVKIVGVGDDPARVAACEAAVRQTFGTQVSAARTQAFSLDVTHPTANKGVVIERLSRYLKIPLERIAAIGDQANDVPMFRRSGVSIAMGNAADEVKHEATFVTTSHADEGFANAVEKVILPRAEPAVGPAVRPTAWLHRLGQSLWLDGLTRDLVRTGALERAIHELSVTGATSNPASFEQALTKGPAYDAAIAALARRETSTEEILYELAIEDLARAADLLRPVHELTDGVDGWVSLEVPPLLAHDAAATIAVAAALFERAGRANLMIEIPGTLEGLAAIEETIFAGIPVYVSWLFSREHYLAAAEAFLRGIERRIEAGLKPEVPSVAAMRVGRWDLAIEGQVPDALRGQLGIAMAQRTYKAYRQLLHSPRWQRIYNAGARPQRLLWASSGAHDPLAADVSNLQRLTAQFTVLAMPERTLKAIASRGEISSLLPADGGTCEQTLAAFTAAGIDLYALATQLQEDATKSSIESWNRLVAHLASKAARLAKPSP